MKKTFERITRQLTNSPPGETELERTGQRALVRAVCWVRFGALFILYVSLRWRGAEGFETMSFVTALAVATCVISYTRYYAWAVVLVALDPIFGVPHFVHSDNGSIYALISAPIWLVSGPFVSGLVLRPAVTAAFVLGTAASFVIIALRVPPEYHQAVASQFIAVLCSSTLALIGNVIRVRSARKIQDERAKVLHSAKLASLGEMAAGVAHELNSPLAAVMLNLEVMREYTRLGVTNTVAIEGRIDGLLQTVERMGQIINGLRTFARDAQDEAFTEGPARVWVDDALNLCRERFRHHGVELRVSVAGLSQMTRVQSVQISQALLNVLNNAYEAVEKLPDRWVALVARATTESLELEIVNSGPPIAEDIAAKMFQPFFTTKDYGDGPGLGLSIARGILKKHGGDLRYEPGPQTTFVLSLPTIKSAR